MLVHVQEACKVRSVQRALLTIKLVLENLIVRLESADSLEDIKLVVTPSIKMIENSRIAVLPEVPGIAVKLGELVDLLSTLQRNLGVKDELGDERLLEIGSKRPLIEANSIACLKTAEYTPYIPVVQGG